MQSAQALAYSFRYMKCGSSATHYGIKKEFQHMSAFKANQHELQQNNESLIGDAQQKEKTVVHQEADKARSAFTEQISRLQSLTDDEFDRLDPSTLEPITTTIRRVI